jgi:colanic acid/amylovoran biosynthesis glycosyltransferase
VVSAYGADLTMLPATQPVWRRRYRELFADVSAVLCEGPHMGQTAVALGCPRDRVRIHPLGVDLRRIPFRPRTRQWGEPLRVLMACSFREKKGMTYGIEALALLRRQGVDLELTIVGGLTRERDAQELERIEDALAHLRAPVHRLGFLSHGALLDEAFRHHLFLSPSVTAADGDAEGGAPVTIIEMAASGMPVASTRHCDIPAVLGAENRALLVEERDVPALAAALQTLAEGDWYELVRANRALIERNHDLHNQSARLERLYREVAAE